MKKILTALVGVVCIIVLFFILRIAGADRFFYHVNFLAPSEQACDSIVIVGVDAASINTIGGWPWPRTKLATVINTISSAGPKAVALDMLFPMREDPEGNDSLAAALSRVPNLVLPFRVESFAKEGEPGPAAPEKVFNHRFLRVAHTEGLSNIFFYTSGQITEPDTLFSQHSEKSGFVNISTRKASQVLDEVIHVVNAGQDYYPSFGLAATAAFLDLSPAEVELDGMGVVKLGNHTIPLSAYAASTFIHFRGKPGTITTVSAADCYNGTIDKTKLAGKLVFMGITESGIPSDFFITPTGSSFPGVEVWGTVAADILQRKIIGHDGIGALLGWILALGIFPGLLFVPGRFRMFSIIGAGTLAIGAVLGMLILFSSVNYYFNPLPMLLASITAIFVLGFTKSSTIIIQQGGGVDLEPREHRSASLPPPSVSDYLQSIPECETAEHVKQKIGSSNLAAPAGNAAFAAPERTMVENDVQSQVAFEGSRLSDFTELAGGKIVKFLGAGGMADVYLVYNPRLEVYRAVKVIKPNNSKNLSERFETETKILSNLSNGNIVQCYSAGNWFDLPYIEMEYIHGVSIDAILEKKGMLTVQETLAVGILTCRALQYAHRKVVTIYGTTYNGVVHRDLKPANIMIARNGQIKLTDFGIARPAQVHLHTVDTGTIVGTLPYLAPEQLDGREIDGRTDLYALGVTLYEFLTGKRALPQNEVTSLLAAKSIGNIAPLTPSAELAESTIRIINKSIAVSPDDRYASADEMCKDLEKEFSRLVKSDGYKVLENMATTFWA